MPNGGTGGYGGGPMGKTWPGGGWDGFDMGLVDGSSDH
jgi:hypothetical protein